MTLERAFRPFRALLFSPFSFPLPFLLLLALFFSFSFSFSFPSPLPAAPATPEQAEAAIATLQATALKAKNFYPDLPVAEELLSAAMVDRLRARAATHPTETVAEAAKIGKKLGDKFTWKLKLEICEFGRFLELGKTNQFTYKRRRAVLVELHDLLKASGAFLKSHFPKGNPAVQLTVENVGKAQYALCDEYIAHLYKLYKDEVEGKGEPGSGGVTSAGGGSGSIGVADGRFDEDGEAPEPEAVSPDRDEYRSKRLGGYISSYFTWVLGLLGVIAVLALAFHLLRSSKKLLAPAVDSLKGSDDGLSEAEKAGGFKGALALFQKGKTEMALEAFGKVAARQPVDAPRCYYYSVLCHLRLGRIDLARICLDKLALEVFSLEEVYRLAITFEEGEALDVARKLYESIAERDGTFKDIQQRLRVLDTART